MKKIIHKLYRGELCDMITGLSETLSFASEKATELREKLRETLTEEQKKIFDEYSMLCEERYFNTEEARYIQGFKTGLLIGVECIDGDTKIKFEK